MKKINIDVTNLIETVKKENRLFYPVMMYIVLKNLQYKEDYIFYQNSDGFFLKTMFHPCFETFYKNYIFDSYQAKKEQNIPTNSTVFGLYEDKEKKADFLFLPFIEDKNKTFLPVVFQKKILKNFETNLKQACLSCNF